VTPLTPTPGPRSALRHTALALIACLALGLAACSSSESLSQQLPIGPEPSITVLLRVGGDAGTTVQLLGTGTTQASLDVAASAVAKAAFPNAQVGAPEPLTSTDPDLTVATVPVQLPNGEMTFNLDSDGMSSALQGVHPKALSVWVCTDDRRSVTVDSTAPGAVSSDVATGQCQVAGSTLAHDGVTWTATVVVGGVEPPSKLPWLIAGGVLVLIGLGAWFLWPRRSKLLETTSSSSPPLPPAPPVH
jgi:hypothetical protein